MSFIQINDSCYYYHSSVNIGYVHEGTEGILIDAGIDRSSIKKVLKELKKRELPLTHLFITHAHADHYGGASYVQENYDVLTFAPRFEEAILRNPDLEPLYLFGGNDPVDELNNKFLQGPAMKVDEILTEGPFKIGDITAEAIFLPGHSYHQLAVKVNGVLYAADSYFSEEALHKHKVPYITDADLTLKSLKKLLEVDCEGCVPGHGDFESDATSTIQKNIDYHKRLMKWVEVYVHNHDQGVTHEQLVADMCTHYDVQAPQLSQWLLYRTAVTAYLVALKKDQRVIDRIDRHRWTFYPGARN